MTTQKSFTLWPGVVTLYSVKQTLVSKKTPFQSLDICDTIAFGRALFLDGKPQSAERDEHIYHEALVQPALIAHPDPRSVFIAGGAEGATLREVLRHPSIERVVMVDIDGDAVEFARLHMQPWHRGGFDDPRSEIVIDDARAYLQRSDEKFDAIIVDVTDPISGGPSYLLFTQEFYQLARDRLNPGGIIAVQGESASPVLLTGHVAIKATLQSVFAHVHDYSAFIPFFGEPWGFVIGSQDSMIAGLTEVEIDRRLESRGICGDFYDGETHVGMFNRPRSVRKAHLAPPQPITDDQPLVVQ